MAGFMNIVAAIGSILLAICSIPLAVDAVVDRPSTLSINSVFLHTWTLGEVLTTSYCIYQGYYILLINYGINLTALAVVYYQRARALKEYQDAVVYGHDHEG